jgi:hypothetical protein
MKKIAVVAIWFGKLPDYFPFWVRSLEVNKEYDFLLFTDQEIRIDHPQNLKVQPSTLDALKLQVQNELHINPHFKEPYKFCDYRPAFGELFNKELASYDFWGYCDMDLMFGQLSDFITPDVLERYKKIFNRGHFTLYKNEPEINALYRSSSMTLTFSTNGTASMKSLMNLAFSSIIRNALLISTRILHVLQQATSKIIPPNSLFGTQDPFSSTILLTANFNTETSPIFISKKGILV